MVNNNMTKLNVNAVTKKLPNRTSVPKIAIQHSSLDSAYKWVTHSFYETSKSAASELNKITRQFPTHYKWRTVKLK